MDLLFLSICYSVSLIGALSPLTFRVSTERYEFTCSNNYVACRVGVSGGVLWSFVIFVAFGLVLFFIYLLGFFFSIFSPLRESPLKFLAGMV